MIRSLAIPKVITPISDPTPIPRYVNPTEPAVKPYWTS